MNVVKINTTAPYDVVVGQNILPSIGERTLQLSDIKYKKVAVITDCNVDKLYSETVVKSYEKAGFEVFKFVFQAGEASKSEKVLFEILEWLIENQLTRSDVLVALGGGVCGDLVGFAASIYLRGIDFIQIPTTFLSAIDSSVGGKTAINVPGGKNLVGTFWQPRLVLCDTNTLSTLSQEDFNSGVAEAIKYGCIWDKALFDRFKTKDWYADIPDVVTRCVEIKAEVVAQDEKDLGLRTILNFGHTIGHAVEKLSNLQISHGYGVAIGMYLLTKASEIDGLTHTGTADSIKKVLDLYDIPCEVGYSHDEIALACLGDKKRSGDKIKLVLLPEIGSYIIHEIPVSELSDFIEGGFLD